MAATTTNPPPNNPQRASEPSEVRFQQLKTRIHAELVESLDLSVLGQIDERQFNVELQPLIQDICRRRGAGLSEAEQQRMVAAVGD